jgi:phage tail sheath gpL-like
MGGLQAPIINWQIKAGESKAGFEEHRILVIAQSNGEAVAKELLQDVQQTEIITLCGVGSMASMAFERIKKFNKVTEIDIIPLAEPVGGTKAQGGIKVTGTATENKTLNFKVGDDVFEYNATIIKDETASQIAIKIMDAVNAKTSYPFTASIDAGDNTLVLIDFKIKGEVANGIISKINTRVLGLSFTVQEFTGGAGAYDTDGILDTLIKRYHTVIFDSAMSFDAVEDFMESRVNTTNAVKGGVGFTLKNGNYTTLKAFANSKNSKSMVCFGNLDEMKFNLIPLLAVAEFGAKRALRLTDGAVLGDIVLEAQEAFGGINKSSLPYHNTPMSYDAPKNEIIIEQVQDLNDAGLSLLVPATIGVVLGTVITLYKFDNSGIEDNTFKYLNAVDTSMAIQEYLFSNTKKEFGQTRATGGDLVAGVAMTNTVSVKAYIVGLYEDMVGMALAQGGADAIKSFKKNLTVTLDVASGIYAVFAPTPIVSQFRGLNGVVAIGYEFN